MNRPSEQQIAAWYPRLFRTALRLTGRPDDAADLTQQAFYQALSAWDDFDGGALPTTWLHQILVNCVRDWARRRAVRAARPIEPWDLPGPDAASAGEAVRLEDAEELAALRQAIGGLSEPVRQAFVATVLDGFSYQEAAEMLGVPLATIASRVHQARLRLQAVMRRAFGEA